MFVKLLSWKPGQSGPRQRGEQRSCFSADSANETIRAELHPSCLVFMPPASLFPAFHHSSSRLFSPPQLVIDDSVAMTPFHLLLGRNQQQPPQAAGADADRTTPQSSAAVREVRASAPQKTVHIRRRRAADTWRVKCIMGNVVWFGFSQNLLLKSVKSG